MEDLILKLKTTMNEKSLTAEDVSKFIGCSFKHVYRWLSGEAKPTLIYREAIRRALKKMDKLPSLSLFDMAITDRNLYRKVNRKITHQEKEWLIEHPEDYRIYRKRLRELARKYEIAEENK